MQDAMKKAGIDENLIVRTLRSGLDTPAKDTVFKSLKLAAELMDAGLPRSQAVQRRRGH